MGKGIIKFVLGLVVIVGIIVFAIAGNGINAPTEFKSQYNCDVNLISLKVDVDITGTNKYNITGEIMSAYEDDLMMKNKNGDTVKIADDSYNFISQNNHVIMNGDDVEYVCDGKIKWLADSYDIYDADSNKIAYVKFNIFDTVGVMVDNDGNEIARYDSGYFRYDYVVSIFDNCEIDDESVLMIFASYFSDKRADAE